jgi:hypothetical protein
MIDFLTKQFTFNLSGTSLTVVVGAIAAVIIILIAVIIVLARNYHKLKTPRYGFLGKPLYILLFVGLAIGTVYITQKINSSKIPDINASQELKITIQMQTIQEMSDKVEVKFNIIPALDSLVWGDQGDTFDIYWNLKGPEQQSFVEMGLSRDNLGGVTKTIMKGSYTLETLVVYKGKSTLFTKSVSF